MSAPLKLVKSALLSDWYTIELAKHADRHSLRPTSYGGIAVHYTGRVCDADVEGDADEMRAIASAIEERRSCKFKRCAVDATSDGDDVEFWSPRNSIAHGTVTRADADDLAAQIRRELPAPATEETITLDEFKAELDAAEASSDLAEKLAWLQTNTHALAIEVNEHRVNYESVAAALAKEDVLPEEREACIAAGRIVIVHCYPNTPVGFYRYVSADFARAISSVYELVSAERRASATASESLRADSKSSGTP